MSYVKKIWVDEETPASATNMNNIENGVADNDTAIESPSTTDLLKNTSSIITSGTGTNESGEYIDDSANIVDGLVSESSLKGKTVNISFGSSAEITMIISEDLRTDIATGLSLPIGKYLIFYELTATTAESARNTPYLAGVSSQYESTTENYNVTVGRKLWKVTTTEAKTKFSWWVANNTDEVKIKNIMIILVDDDTYVKTDEELLNVYHFMTTGVKSTLLSFREKSHGKNLARLVEIVDSNWTKIAEAKDLIVGQQYNSHTLGLRTKVSVLTTSGGDDNLIDSETENTQFTWTQDAKDKNMSVYMRDVGSDLKANQVQLEKGTVPTTREDYKSNETHILSLDDSGDIDTLNSVPSGARDRVYTDASGRTWKEKNTDKTILDGNLSWTGFGGGTETYYVSLTAWNTTNNALEGIANSGIATSDDGDYPIVNTIEEIRHILFSTNHSLYLRTKKADIDAMPSGGTLAGMKEYLNLHPISLIYQRATPVITEIKGVVPLKAYKNGTVIIEPFLRQPLIYNSATGNGLDFPCSVSNIEKILDIDGKEVSYTLAEDGMSCTVVGASDGEVYIPYAVIKGENSTVGTFSGKYCKNIKAETDGNGTGITALNKFVNWLKSTIDVIKLWIGNRTYTEKNYIADKESITDNLDSLDIAVKDNADNIATTTSRLNAVAKGTTAYTDTITASGTLTKTIALGASDYKKGYAVIMCTEISIFAYGIKVEFTTANTDSLVSGYCYNPADGGSPTGSAWSRALLGQITKYISALSHIGKMASGNENIDIKECYINGSNLQIEFVNNDSASQSLNTSIYYHCEK